MLLENPLLIVEDDKDRREFVLDAPLYSIGRDPACDIRLFSQFVSRRHATLIQSFNDNGSCYYRIVDGKAEGRVSANGLLINGDRLQARHLQHEDEIIFGPQVWAIYYLHRRDGERPFSGDEPSSPVGRGGGDAGNPNDSVMASPDSWRY